MIHYFFFWFHHYLDHLHFVNQIFQNLFEFGLFRLLDSIFQIFLRCHSNRPSYWFLWEDQFNPYCLHCFKTNFEFIFDQILHLPDIFYLFIIVFSIFGQSCCLCLNLFLVTVHLHWVSFILFNFAVLSLSTFFHSCL